VSHPLTGLHAHPHEGHIHSIATDDLPIFGVEGEPIEGDTLSELLRRQAHPHGSRRKRIARIAYDVYRTCYEHQVLDGIRLQQNSRTIRRDMTRFLTKVRNDARDVTEQVAVVWQNGVTRHVVDEDGNEDEDATKAIRSLAKQAKFDIVSAICNHLAWLQGPQFMVPMVRGRAPRRRLAADVISPHVYDIVQNTDDPLGLPVGLAWHIHTRRLSQHAVVDDIWVLDAVSLRRFRVESEGVDGRINQDRIELVSPPIVHNHGVLPAAPLRFTTPIVGDDWFLCEAQSRLISGTIEVGIKMARMGLVRRAQNHNLLTMIGELEAVPKGQEKADPEAALVASTKRGTQSVAIDVKPYDVDPINFIKEILFHVQCMIEPLGGHVQVDSGQPEIFGKIEIPHEVQVEHRDRQVEPATDYERVFFESATAVGRAEGLPEALDLPAPEDVHDRLRVIYGELSRTVNDPLAATQVEDWKLSRGQTSEVELMRDRLGGATEDEAWKAIQKNMENRARFNDMAARNNLPANDAGTMTAPQALGSMGTPQREANRAEQSAQGEDGGQAGGPEPSEPA
jgi:hypothetical protein